VSTPQFVGDVFLRFGEEETRPLSRSPDATWQKPDVNSNLLFSTQGDDWVGYPLTTAAIGTKRAWLLGEIFGFRDMANSAEEALRTSLETGNYAACLNGHFLLIVRDTATREWHFWTDRFGTIHGYLSGSSRVSAFGTFSPSVSSVGSARRLDWAGLTGFFAFGFFPQDRTFFDDVKILPPASHTVISDDGKLCGQSRYWQWWHRPDESRSYDETVAQFAAIFEEVVREQTETGNIAIPISGGLDSRSAVAALDTERSDYPDRFWAYSYGYGADSVETRIASEIAKTRRLPFEEFEIDDYLFNGIERVLGCVEGFQDITQSRQASITERIQKKAEYVLAAHWGDVWLDDMGFEDSGSSNSGDLESHTLAKISKQGNRWLVDNISRPHLNGENPTELLKSLCAKGFADKEIEDADFRIKAFKTDQWSFRWTIASLRMFHGGGFPRLPFYDTRIADFFCSVPTRFLRGRRLQIDYLKRFAPDLARVKWQYSDANLFRHGKFSSFQLPKRAAKKAVRLITRSKVIERNWEIQFLSEAGRRGLHKWLLRPGLRLHELVSQEAVHDVLNSFYANPLAEKRGYTISMLLTLSCWLEIYG
jgi:asparagine synthase (glutamine-hydrolysing)